MTRDIYALELPRENVSENALNPSAILISSIIYAISVTASSNIYSLFTASILPAIFIKRITPSALEKINVINAVMILTLAVTWPDFYAGLIKGVIIALRVNMIYVAFSAMVYPLGVTGMYEALSGLGVPEKLRVMILLTLRGINILRERYETSIISVKLRAPEINGLMRLKIFAYMAGNIILQSSLRSENMMKAVKCRGGFGGFRYETAGIKMRDIFCVIGFCAYGIIIAVMNYA